MRKLMTAAVALLLLGSGVAFAQAPSAEQQKKSEEAFTKGNTAYNLGRFDEAVDQFTKAYEAWPLPDFLYNIAQSYRLGGNCKQAVYFYKRFRSLKEKDTAAPLTAKKKEEVDKFIRELSDCAAKAETGGNAQPQTIDRPPGIGSTSTTTTTTTPTTTTPTATTTPTTTTTTTTAQKPDGLEQPDEGEEDETEEEVHAQTTVGAKVVSARVVSGIAVISGGENLEFPVQPVFALSGGYPLPAGPAIVEVGAGLSYSPLPYQTMEGQQQGNMFAVRAQAVAMYPVAPKLWLRGELGLGMLSLSGLGMGNPLTTDRSAGSFTLFNVRFGVAADYEITPNIVATVQPFALAYSPGSDGMYADSLREIDVLLGVGYRK